MKIKDCGVLVLYPRQLEITYSIGGLDSNFTSMKVMRSKVSYIQCGARSYDVGLEPAAQCLDVAERQTNFPPDRFSLCLSC